MSDFVPWLIGLATDGGKGVVGNIDARSLGRIADELIQLHEALIDIEELCDGYVDIDRNGQPNLAMKIMTIINIVLKEPP